MATWPAKVNYATGDVLTAANMNTIGGELNDLYTVAGDAAGKNVIINGDFGIWQRGTSFTGYGIYTADRWFITYDNNPTSAAVTRQTFTPGTAPVAGYEGTYFLRMGVTTAGTATSQFLYQKIEDVRTYAGQTVTYSFWAKADSARTVGVYSYQNFGSGGSADVSGTTTNFSVTTSWQRFSMTVTLGAMTGKTIGTNSFLGFVMTMPAANGVAVDFWGIQLEAGSTASIFQTATGTKQGELAACQRYYYRATSSSGYAALSNYFLPNSTTVIYTSWTLPVPLRTIPTVCDWGGNLNLNDGVNLVSGISSITANNFVGNNAVVTVTMSSAVLTTLRAYRFSDGGANTAYIGIGAEL